MIESIEGYQMTDAQKYRMRLIRAHMDYITAEIEKQSYRTITERHLNECLNIQKI